MMTANTTDVEIATFGAGCFWGTEKCFRKQFGTQLVSAVVGYMGNTSAHDCEEVCLNSTNRVEVLQISFEKHNTAYIDFVRFFFDMHDPTMLSKSDNERHTQYRSVIFTHTNEQHKIAEQVRDEVQTNGKIKGRIITEIQPVNRRKFNIAEQKHQNYLNNHYGWLMQS